MNAMLPPHLPRGTVHTGEDGQRPVASWLARAEMRRTTWGFEPGRLFLGTLPEDDSVQVGYGDDRHIVTIAGSRAGKSSSALLPNLLYWPGSMLAIDPKGELARIAGNWRTRFGQVVTLDPFNITGDGSGHCWNPFDELRDTPPENIPDDAALFAEALVVGSQRGDPYWSMSARNLVRGLILHLYATLENPTLTDLRRVLTDADLLTVTLDAMAASDAFDGIVARAGGSMIAKTEKERDSVVSTASEETAFLDSIGLQQISRSSSFRIADMKSVEPLCVFLVLPAVRMATHSRWLRLFLNMALVAFERTPQQSETPCLWLLEEFAQLGHMKSLEAAAGYMAGFGVKLWVVLQDLNQLKTHYPDSWETFIGNAGLVQAFGNSDVTTLNYLSERLGQTIVTAPHGAARTAAGLLRGQHGGTIDQQAAPLLAPFEIAQHFRRESELALILVTGEKPLAVKRVRWDMLI
jgi:type IV secretion system protein VirD4